MSALRELATSWFSSAWCELRTLEYWPHAHTTLVWRQALAGETFSRRDGDGAVLVRRSNDAGCKRSIPVTAIAWGVQTGAGMNRQSASRALRANKMIALLGGSRFAAQRGDSVCWFEKRHDGRSRGEDRSSPKPKRTTSLADLVTRECI